MPTEILGGTQTCVVTTAHTVVNASTEQGNFLFEVDLSELANGDTIEITVKTKLRSTSSEVVRFFRVYSHQQGEPIVASFPFVSLGTITCTLKITEGSNRDVVWSLKRL